MADDLPPLAVRLGVDPANGGFVMDFGDGWIEGPNGTRYLVPPPPDPDAPPPAPLGPEWQEVGYLSED